MKTHAWNRTVGTWAGMTAMVYGSWLMATTAISIWWMIATFLIYMSYAVSITVGYHRLFVHDTFKCTRLWQWIFGILGAISLNSSPVQWGIVHSAHHLFSDTDRDPHISNWRYFFVFKDRKNLKANARAIRLLRDPMHKFLMNYSLSLCIAAGILAAICGWNAFIFLYAAPIGLYLFIGGIHTMISHRNSNPQNYWWFEFLIPLAGEWLHKIHHEHPGQPTFAFKPYHLDLGGVLIDCIKDEPC